MIHNESAKGTGDLQAGERHYPGEACGDARGDLSHRKQMAEQKDKAKRAPRVQDKKAAERQEMNVAIYARVSSEKQEKEATVQSQIAALKDYAKEKGHVIAKEYVDEGYSGEMLARPYLEKLRDDAAKKMFEAVLVHAPDRLSRKFVHLGIITEELKRYDVEVIFISNPAKDERPEGMLLEGLQGLIAEYERTKIIERTRRGKLFKAKEGILISSIGPYGYSYVKKNADKKTKGHYVVNECEAVIVALIFDLFVKERLSKRAVARELTKRGIKPRKGIHWRTSTLDKILRNETYIGIAHYNKHVAREPLVRRKKDAYSRRKNSSLRLRPREEWIPIRLDDNLKILDDGIFHMAQELLKKNAGFLPRESKNDYMLKGLVFCGNCSSPYVGCPTHGKLYYRCGERHRKFPEKKECRAGSVKADKLEAVVWNTISEALQNPDLVISEIERYHEDANEQSSKIEAEVKAIEKRLVSLEESKDKLLDAYSEGIIGKAELKQQIDKGREKEAFLFEERRKLVEKLSKAMSITEIKRSIHDYCDAVKPRLDSLSREEIKRIVRLLVKKIILEQDGTVRITAVIPIRNEPRFVATSSGCCVHQLPLLPGRV